MYPYKVFCILEYSLNDFILSKKIFGGKAVLPLMISVNPGLDVHGGLPVESAMDANKFNMDLIVVWDGMWYHSHNIIYCREAFISV